VTDDASPGKSTPVFLSHDVTAQQAQSGVAYELDIFGPSGQPATPRQSGRVVFHAEPNPNESMNPACTVTCQIGGF
jgi:hypothetical protein